MRQEDVEGQVVEEIGGEVIVRAELAGDQRVRAEGEVDSSGAEGGQLGLEEGVGICEDV